MAERPSLNRARQSLSEDHLNVARLGRHATPEDANVCFCRAENAKPSGLHPEVGRRPLSSGRSGSRDRAGGTPDSLKAEADAHPCGRGPGLAASPTGRWAAPFRSWTIFLRLEAPPSCSTPSCSASTSPTTASRPRTRAAPRASQTTRDVTQLRCDASKPHARQTWRRSMFMRDADGNRSRRSSLRPHGHSHLA